MMITELPIDEQAFVNEVYGNYINGQFINRETGEVLTVEDFDKWWNERCKEVLTVEDFDKRWSEICEEH